MKPAPSDWPRLSSSLFYVDAAAAIDWLCAGFGFRVRIRIDGPEGRIVHSELEDGESVVMVSSEERDSAKAWKRTMRSPRSLGGACTQALMLYVDDADAHCAHARSHGAVIAQEPATIDYGAEYWTDRSYGALDLEGHFWWFVQRLRDAPPRPA